MHGGVSAIRCSAKQMSFFITFEGLSTTLKLQMNVSYYLLLSMLDIIHGLKLPAKY